MKRFLLLLLTLFIAAPAFPTTPIKLGRGINISHWLSQSSARGKERKAWFTQEDVRLLAEAGYDHLRIPVDEEQLFDEELHPDKEAFRLLHRAIGWCEANRLKVVVDLHILRTHHFNAAYKPLFSEQWAQERFYSCWERISEELHIYPNELLAYELMNEPVADDPEAWNRVVNECLAHVRALEPERTILIGANRWQAYDMVERLRLPDDDRALILSFHFYHPMLLTHYRASWMEELHDISCRVVYPGELISEEEYATLSPAQQAKYEYGTKSEGYFDIHRLETMILRAVEAARAENRPLYLGEFGVIHGGDRASRLNWMRDVVALCEKYGIDYASWDYKGSFGIYDRARHPDAELLRILTGTTQAHKE